MNDAHYNWSIDLVCPEGNHEPIKLIHKEPMFIGRSPETRIVDPRCSRRQVQITADLVTGDVHVVQTGTNSSVLDGMEMIKDKVYTMKQNSTLYILTGQFPQRLKMKSATELNKKDKTSKHNHSSSEIERKRSPDIVICQNKRSTSGFDPKTCTSYEEINKSSKKRHLLTDSNNGACKKQRASANDTRHDANQKKLIDVANKPEKLKSLPHILESTFKVLESSRLHVSGSPQLTSKHVSKGTKLESVHSTDISKPNAQIESPALRSECTSNSVNDLEVTVSSTESRWDQYDSVYIFTTKGLKHRRKIAAFDLDDTIITTHSRKVFPTHPGDWRILFEKEIPQKLRKLQENRYKIVFITNQLGVSMGKIKIDDLKTKLMNIVDKIEVPLQIIVSTKTDIYRKPCLGMWNLLCGKLNGGVNIEVSQSFYVGDAAGRPKDWQPKMKKDFSCSDRLFALNIGLEFKTPEEYFLGHPPAKYNMPEFDPRHLSADIPLLDPANALSVGCRSPEVIVLTGCPASGKSFFVKKILEPKGYVHINRDSLKTWQKCVNLCCDSLQKGKSVVIDSTNPDVESRARYISVAQTAHVPCRCFLFTTTIEHAKHNERFREITDKSHQSINEIIMYGFNKKFVKPEKKEGFTEIVMVNFVPRFDDPNLKKLYGMFLV